MSDAIESSFLRRLFRTPLSDLLRGRVTGRPPPSPRLLATRAERAAAAAAHVARAAAEAALPAEARDLVRRVIRRTRIWPHERADVSAELVGHFADGLAAGSTVSQLVAAFGDERQAARLIRRAKIRNRSAFWHALRFTRRSVGVLVLLYAAMAVRFYVGRPTVSADYLVQLNAPIERVPANRRAWPVYAKALVEMDVPGASRDPATQPADAERQRERDFGELLDARPGWRRWPALAAWVDARGPQLEQARRAAGLPALGFVLGTNGSQLDGPLRIDERPGSPRNPGPTDGEPAGPQPLMGVLMPALNPLRTLGNVLAADLRVARSRGDGTRAARDVEALLGMADQSRGPFLINQLLGIGLDALAFQELDHLLATTPALLSDADLVRLAHRLAEVGQRTALVDYAGERLFFYDVLQRSFTDDGAGDGRLTPAGLLFLHGVVPSGGTYAGLGFDDFLTAVGPTGLVASRREQRAEYDRLMDAVVAQQGKPARSVDLSAAQYRLGEIHRSLPLGLRYLPLWMLAPFPGPSFEQAERLLGKRDGMAVAIALELYRRRHGGAYPPTLDALVPGLLPAVPADRITGDPVKYRLVDGRPVVYSVGADRDDDGGRRPTEGNEFEAAWWPNLTRNNPSVARRMVTRPSADTSPADGDWVLYPNLPEVPEPPSLSAE